jgi:hypothetical protein
MFISTAVLSRQDLELENEDGVEQAVRHLLNGTLTQAELQVLAGMPSKATIVVGWCAAHRVRRSAVAGRHAKSRSTTVARSGKRLRTCTCTCFALAPHVTASAQP